MMTDPSLTCEGSSIEFTITVNPTAQVDPVDSLDLCNGDTVVDFTTSNGGRFCNYVFMGDYRW